MVIVSYNFVVVYSSNLYKQYKKVVFQKVCLCRHLGSVSKSVSVQAPSDSSDMQI